MMDQGRIKREMMKYKDFMDLATISRSHHSSLGFFFGQKFLIHKLHRDSSIGEMCDRQSGQEFQPTDAVTVCHRLPTFCFCSILRGLYVNRFLHLLECWDDLVGWILQLG